MGFILKQLFSQPPKDIVQVHKRINKLKRQSGTKAQTTISDVLEVLVTEFTFIQNLPVGDLSFYKRPFFKPLHVSVTSRDENNALSCKHKEIVMQDIGKLIQMLEYDDHTPSLPQITLTLNALLDEIKQFAKKNGIQNMSRRGFLTRLGVGAALLNANTAALYAKKLSDDRKKLPFRNDFAICIAGPKTFIESTLMNFAQIYIDRIQVAFGAQTKYIFATTSREIFKKIIASDEIQNIALLAHGNNDTAYLSDCTLLNEIFRKPCPYASKIPRHTSMKRKDPYYHKSGYFLKHTCGEAYDDKARQLRIEESRITLDKHNMERISPELESELHGILGEPMFKKDHISFWEHTTSPIEFIVNPCKGIKMKDHYHGK